MQLRQAKLGGMRRNYNFETSYRNLANAASKTSANASVRLVSVRMTILTLLAARIEAAQVNSQRAVDLVAEFDTIIARLGSTDGSICITKMEIELPPFFKVIPPLATEAGLDGLQTDAVVCASVKTVPDMASASR
jgi:hypothetical protein